MREQTIEFKKYLKDFIVEEILEKEPSWKWDIIYVLIEKRNKTTFEILKHIMKTFNIDRNCLWIAWLKDKFWITRQWITISKDNIKKIWWINNFLSTLRKICFVVKSTYWEDLLKIWQNKGNFFKLTLRWSWSNKQDTISILEKFEKIIDEIKKKWIPNIFWVQRLWEENKNYKLGYLLLTWKIKKLIWDSNTVTEKRFKIQIFTSYLFNRYIELRTKSWYFDKPMIWDIITSKQSWDESDSTLSKKSWDESSPTLSKKSKNRSSYKVLSRIEDFDQNKHIITWPMFGFNMLNAENESWILEQKVLKEFNMNIDDLKLFKNFDIFWLRRNLVLFPENIKYKISWENNIYMEFFLPKWSYASIVIEFIQERLLLSS